jgi:hypothetical protein
MLNAALSVLTAVLSSLTLSGILATLVVIIALSIPGGQQVVTWLRITGMTAWGAVVIIAAVLVGRLLGLTG